MAEIRWGIIGCGDVTEVKSGPALQKAKGSQLVAVMRRNGELAKDYALRHGVPRWYDQAEALIHDPEVDAVYIATPPAFHKEYALAAARAGKPVYVEKPMALNFTECEEMITECERRGVPLYVAYYRRTLPRFVKVKELIAAGAIGQVRTVTATLLRTVKEEEKNPLTRPWRIQPDVAGGGYFFDLASHTLDLFDDWFGPISRVNGFAANQGGYYSAEDIVTGSFIFESGIHGTGTWCFTSYTNTDRVEIIGTAGKIVVSMFEEEPVKLVTGNGAEQLFHIEHPAHVQQPLIQSIVDELLGSGHCPSTGKSGARTNRVMDLMTGQSS